MKIDFASTKLEKVFNSEKELNKAYGKDQAQKIKRRMAVLKAASSLADVPTDPPDRRHLLIGDKKNQFAVDLKHPYRLIFKPDGQIPLLPDGGIDLRAVKEIIILEVVDYHGN